VVWPENAVSFLLEPNEALRGAAAALLRPSGALLLTGGPRFAQLEPGRVAFFNSAFLLDGQGAVRATYDKRRLVPFAEYAPLPRVPALGWRFDAPGDYTPGTHPTVFPAPAPFGVLICFEAIYPDLARDLVRGGAELLVNISNDAWFGTSAGLEQHFAITVFRAVEFRRALARATNTGVTAVIGPSGRQLAAFPREQRGAWTVAVPRRQDETVYARFGDGPLALLAMSAVVAGLLGGAPARRARYRGGRGDA
jgi:apolipoprotein N-acyltransferase